MEKSTLETWIAGTNLEKLHGNVNARKRSALATRILNVINSPDYAAVDEAIIRDATKTLISRLDANRGIPSNELPAVELIKSEFLSCVNSAATTVARDERMKAPAQKPDPNVVASATKWIADHGLEAAVAGDNSGQLITERRNHGTHQATAKHQRFTRGSHHG